MGDAGMRNIEISQRTEVDETTSTFKIVLVRVGICQVHQWRCTVYRTNNAIPICLCRDITPLAHSSPFLLISEYQLLKNAHNNLLQQYQRRGQECGHTKGYFRAGYKIGWRLSIVRGTQGRWSYKFPLYKPQLKVECLSTQYLLWSRLVLEITEPKPNPKISVEVLPKFVWHHATAITILPSRVESCP